jgi:hypothetical protein
MPVGKSEIGAPNPTYSFATFAASAVFIKTRTWMTLEHDLNIFYSLSIWLL